MNNITERIALKEKVGYPLGDFASVLFFQMFMSFLLYFYTDVMGIAAGLVGTMMLITKLWDTVNDPMMGMIADRTNTKWGKFRPYLFWLAVPFGVIGFFTFFVPPGLSGTGLFAYAFITYTLMGMVYTAINIPYNAMLGVITSDTKQRLVMSSLKFYGAFSAGFVIKTFHVPLVEFFGKGDEQLGYTISVGLYAVVAILLFIACFSLTKERVHPPIGQKTNLKQDLKDLLQNRPWIIMFFLGLFTLTSVSIRYAAIMYYFKYYVPSDVELPFLVSKLMTLFRAGGLAHNMAAMSIFYAIGSICSLVGIYVIQRIARLIGKKPMYALLMLITFFVTAIFFFLGPNDISWMIFLNALSEFVMGPTSVLVWAMYADTADWSEWKTGRRATGLVFSAATFSQKMGWTVGGALSGWILAWFGYKAGVVQTGNSILGVKLMISIFPAIGALLASIAVMFYKIDEKLMEKITADLKERREMIQE